MTLDLLRAFQVDSLPGSVTEWHLLNKHAFWSNKWRLFLSVVGKAAPWALLRKLFHGCLWHLTKMWARIFRSLLGLGVRDSGWEERHLWPYIVSRNLAIAIESLNSKKFLSFISWPRVTSHIHWGGAEDPHWTQTHAAQRLLCKADSMGMGNAAVTGTGLSQVLQSWRGSTSGAAAVPLAHPAVARQMDIKCSVSAQQCEEQGPASHL